DGTVALAMSLILFLIPARDSDGKRSTVLDADVFARIPWNIVLLFGGGFALAAGLRTSGLDAILAKQLTVFGRYPLAVAILCVALGMTFLTEFTSTTASTQMILPILVAAAAASGVAPLYLLLPATLS